MHEHTDIRSRTTAPPAFTPAPSGLLERRCACGGNPGPTGECAECRKKRLSLQRMPVHPPAAAPSAPPVVHDVLRSPGQPLDPDTRTFMEERFGHNFADVRVHTGERAAESARAVDALAYTVGRDIVFGAGQYAPDSPTGRELVAHEIAHVVQQSAHGRAQGQLEVGAADDPLEREADAAAARALAGRISAPAPPLGASIRRPALQRAALHTGQILDEGSCEHLACNSKWACEDNENGLTCPKGTRNASETKKYRPLFTCDTKCENNKTCSDSDNWMALPGGRWARSKCNQDLVICANGKFTHGYVRDRSEREKAWEVSHGIQDRLGVSPYGTFAGAIYPDEADAAFKKDERCHPKPVPPKSEGSAQSETSSPSETLLTPPVNRDNPSDLIDE